MANLHRGHAGAVQQPNTEPNERNAAVYSSKDGWKFCARKCNDRQCSKRTCWKHALAERGVPHWSAFAAGVGLFVGINARAENTAQ